MFSIHYYPMVYGGFKMQLQIQCVNPSISASRSQKLLCHTTELAALPGSSPDLHTGQLFILLSPMCRLFQVMIFNKFKVSKYSVCPHVNYPV